MANGWRGAGLLLALACALAAQGGQTSLEPRSVGGKNASAAGMLLAREGPDRPWLYVERRADVFTRDRLLALPGTRAEIDADSGKVSLTLWGNVPQLSDFAGFQSEVVLHETRSNDLDFTLVAGRVLLTSKKAGAVRVWVRLPGLVEGRPNPPEVGACQFVFANAGDSVALDIHGRWPRGVAFSRPAKSTPRAIFNVLVLKGQVEMRMASQQLTLSAPPGLAEFTWDSVSGPAAGPRRLEELPGWVNPAAPNKNVTEVATRYEDARMGRAPLGALQDLIAQAEKDTDATRALLCRQFAVLSMAAMDELPRVVAAVELPRFPGVRDVAIVALRHHIGELPGREVALYYVLREKLNYTEGAADAFLQLLHSPFDTDQAETYDTLLAYLRHPRPAVRELARWHLERYLPDGKTIAFDALAAEDARDKAIAAWKKLIEEKRKKPPEKP
jgi:hypothetical protein